MIKILTTFILTLSLMACSTVATKPNHASFSGATDNFAANRGKQVEWTGRIIKTTNYKNRTSIEMMAVKSRYNKDEGNDLGRFLAEFSSFKDPAQFSAGRYMKVIGVLSTQRAKKIGSYNYNYPVVRVSNHTLYDKATPYSGPKLNWGLGWNNHGGVGVNIGLGNGGFGWGW